MASESESPRRIISVVPSQTELLYALGLEDRVVGITRYCVHPTHWKSNKTIIGGTKKFDFDAIERLQPDLIIANKEENYKEGIARLQRDYRVWVSDIFDLPDALKMIKDVGTLTGTEARAAQLVASIQSGFRNLKKRNPSSVLYLIWRKPWMGAASNTFINSMIKEIGLRNVLEDSERYPELKTDDLRSLKPDYIFLSSEPYPFSSQHLGELKEICPESRIMLVDGEMFSWYGSRLLLSPEYFNGLML